MAGRARKTAVETEDINLADFDLDAWIDGTTGIQGCAKIIQRGELLAQMERLDQELRVARRIPEDQRGVADRDPDTIQAEIERVAEQIWDSVLWVYVQDRTQARREKLAKADLERIAEGIGVDVYDLLRCGGPPGYYRGDPGTGRRSAPRPVPGLKAPAVAAVTA